MLVTPQKQHDPSRTFRPRAIATETNQRWLTNHDAADLTCRLTAIASRIVNRGEPANSGHLVADVELPPQFCAKSLDEAIPDRG
jgi:hypothetical protein